VRIKKQVAMLKQVAHRLKMFFSRDSHTYQPSPHSAADAPSDFELANDCRIISDYSKNRHCEISRLCDVHGSDKGTLVVSGHPYSWPPHNYAEYYSRLFSHCRQNITKVFECGVGTNNPNLPSSMGVHGRPGASLRVWRDYFPNATVYGADIDESILFKEERILTYFIDQREPIAIKCFWEAVGEVNFDLMIDDGLHTFEAGSILFQHSVDKLSSTGIYVIEDVSQVDLVKYKKFFFHQPYLVEYVSLLRPSIDLMDNSLVVVRKSC